MAHAFNLSTWEAEVSERISEIQASLVYITSSRIARAMQKNPVSIINKQTNNNDDSNNKNKHFVFLDKVSLSVPR